MLWYFRKTHTIPAINPAEISFSPEKSQIADGIVKKYASKASLDLELLATADYVANVILNIYYYRGFLLHKCSY